MSAIWQQPATLETLNSLAQGGLTGHLGIVFTEVGDDYLKASMPVEPRLHQPMGLMHGGASCVLAETLGSVGGMLCVPPGKACVGVEINANHLRAVRRGVVTGTARPLHIGSRTQVWEIHLHDEANRLICVSRLTLAVVEGRGSDVGGREV